MARPAYTPVFEETEKTIRDRMLGRIPEDWRKEPGDYIYDAVAASPLEVQLGEIQRDTILQNAHAQYAVGENLDLKLSEIGLTREPATANKRALSVQADAGVVIPKDYTVTSVLTDTEGNPYEYKVDVAVTYGTAGSLTVNITCTETGAITNLPNGTEFILQPPIPGVRVITDSGTTTLAVDAESDEAAYERYLFKVQNPDTGGNKNDYVRWAQDSGLGVGKAKCLPRWNGNGTVKVVIVGEDYKPALAGVVTALQAYMDPGAHGLGEGKAPCGASTTVVAATSLSVAITATVVLSQGYNTEAVKAAFSLAVDNYLKSLALVELPNDPERDNVPVVYAKIGSLLIGTEGVANYSGLTLNGATADIPVFVEQVAVRGAVTFN